MSTFRIITDACADLPASWIESEDITVIPMEFSLLDETYHHDPYQREMSTETFYQILRNKAVAKTSQVSATDFVKVFEPFLEQGIDILSLSFSSALSGTYNSSLAARDLLLKRYPDRTIICIDSLCASLGQGLFVYYARKWQKQGKTIQETAKWLEENKLRFCHLFTVDDLGHLKRGGRLSAPASFLGTILMLKPVLHVSDEGKLVPLGRSHGRKASLKELLRRMEESIVDDSVIFISHGDDEKTARDVEQKIRELHPQVELLLVSPIGPTIGAHSGPGTIALFFLGRHR